MSDKDYYKILGVEKTVNAQDLKKAFYKKAHTCHPDKAKDETERKEFEAKFKELNEAYQVLSDENKRAQYDRFGAAGVNGGGAGGGGFNWQDWSNMAGGAGGAQGMNFDFGDFSDIFEGFFGGGMGGRSSAQQRRKQGSDLQVAVEISLEEAFKGKKIDFEYERWQVCSHCKGEGAEPGTKVKTCSQCNGRGKVIGVQNTIFGQIQTTQTCPTCGGKGKTFEKVCSVCNGQGRERQKEKVEIKIPAGISDGEMIKMADKGDAGEGGHSFGDLYVVIRVKRDPRFERDGDDIYSELEIALDTAILGAKIPVPTIDGTVKLSVPSGTVSGEKFRLKGQGMPRLNHFGRGDHYVSLKIKIPKDLSGKQKKLLQEFMESLS
ncbi:MAG TPA: molecular chaperone DnaJ [bacterium]|nr:molecular chaperone DnaJ [bacterium]